MTAMMPTVRTRLALMLALSAGLQTLSIPAVAQGGGKERPFAQILIDDVMKRHQDVKGMELARVRGEGCVTIAATDAEDIGHECDSGERAALRGTEPSVEEPSEADPAYIITNALHDKSGAVIGLLILDILPTRGQSRAAVVARAREIRKALESRIPSAERLTAPVDGTGAR